MMHMIMYYNKPQRKKINYTSRIETKYSTTKMEPNYTSRIEIKYTSCIETKYSTTKMELESDLDLQLYELESDLNLQKLDMITFEVCIHLTYHILVATRVGSPRQFFRLHHDFGKVKGEINLKEILGRLT